MCKCKRTAECKAQAAEYVDRVTNKTLIAELVEALDGAVEVLATELGLSCSMEIKLIKKAEVAALGGIAVGEAVL